METPIEICWINSLLEIRLYCNTTNRNKRIGKAEYYFNLFYSYILKVWVLYSNLQSKLTMNLNSMHIFSFIQLNSIYWILWLLDFILQYNAKTLLDIKCNLHPNVCDSRFRVKYRKEQFKQWIYVCYNSQTFHFCFNDTLFLNIYTVFALSSLNGIKCNFSTFSI